MIVLFVCIIAIIACCIYSKFANSSENNFVQKEPIEQSSMGNVQKESNTHLKNIYETALSQAITIKTESSCIMFTYNKGLSQFKDLLPDELMVTFLKDLTEIVEENEVFAVVNIDGFSLQMKVSCRGHIYWGEENKKVVFVQSEKPICMILTK